MTAPRGNSGGYGPLAWVRGLAAAHAKLDAYAHNPYPTRPCGSPLLGACGYCDVISMANLGRLSKQVQHYLGHKPIWLTEYGYQTNPPDRFGVAPALQATYVGEAAMRAYQLSGVSLLIQYLLKDEPQLDRFQTGLFTVHGTPKPAYSAFRFPLAQVRRTGSRAALREQLDPAELDGIISMHLMESDPKLSETDYRRPLRAQSRCGRLVRADRRYRCRGGGCDRGACQR